MACTTKDGVCFVGRVFGPEKSSQGFTAWNYHRIPSLCPARFKSDQGALAWLGILLLVFVALTSMSARVDAAYIGLDGEPVSQDIVSSWSYRSDGHLSAGEYLDKGWYYLLDEGQYDYLDRGQYNLMGGLNYVLGHPAYPKLFERVAGGGIGFESAGFTGFFTFPRGLETGNYRPWFWGWKNAVSNGVPVPGRQTAFRSFGAGDYIDRRWYDYLDEGQYYYLDKTQYVLIGGLGYLYGRFSVDPASVGRATHRRRPLSAGESNSASLRNVPEPSMIAVLTFGCLCLGRFGRRRRSEGQS